MTLSLSLSLSLRLIIRSNDGTIVPGDIRTTVVSIEDDDSRTNEDMLPLAISLSLLSLLRAEGVPGGRGRGGGGRE